MPREVLIRAALLVAAAVASSRCADGPEITSTPPFRAWYAAEFLTYSQMQTALPSLRRHGHGLIPAIPRAKIGDPELESLLRAAHAQGVPVRAWFLLDDADGYWLNESNAPAVETTVTELMDWLDGIDAGVEWIAFDMEPTLADANRLEDEFSSGETTRAIEFLRSRLDPAAFARGHEAFRRIASDVHARGYRTSAFVFPQVLDDPLDGDDDIQDAFGTPVWGVGWDEIAVMAYRTIVTALSGLPAESSFVADAAIRSRDQAAMEAMGVLIGVGTIGSVGKVELPGFEQPHELYSDIAVLRGLGMNEVFVFSLDGALKSPLGAEPWLRLRDVPPRRMDGRDLAWGVTGAAFGALDEMLESP